MKMRCNYLNKFTYTVLLVAVTFVLSVNAQIINVTARDPRINYVGDWVDQDSGGHKFTNTLGSSLSFTFQGSAIFWYSTKDPNGGVASVFVDSDGPHVVDASAGTEKDDNPTLEVMFSQSTLESSKEHTFNITYVGPGSLGGPYVTIYLLAFSTAANSVPEDVPPSNSSVQAPEPPQHDTVITSVIHTVTTVAHPPSETTTTTKNMSFTTTSATTSSSSANIPTSATTPATTLATIPGLTSMPLSGSSGGATPSVVGGAVGTQSPTTTPTPSPSDIAVVLHATQRMNVILGAVLGPIGGLFLIGAIVLLILWLRHRKRHRLRQEEAAAPLFTREAPAPSGHGFGSKMVANRSQLTPSTRIAVLSDDDTNTPPGEASSPSSDISGYIGQNSISDLGTSPPEYSA